MFSRQMLVMILAVLLHLPALAQQSQNVPTATLAHVHELCVRGKSLLDDKDYSSAMQLYQEASSFDPTQYSAAIHLNIGFACTMLARYEAAAVEYKKALSFEPGMPEALVNLASSYQQLGKLSEAADCYQQYLSLHPTAADALTVRQLLKAIREAYPNIEKRKTGSSKDYLSAVTREGKLIWAHSPVTVFVDINNCPTGFPSLAHSAFDDWCKATRGALAWQEAADPQSADIVIAWTSDRGAVTTDGAGVEGGATQTVFLDRGGWRELQKVQVILLTTDLSSGEVVSAAAMKRRCLHEVGHALGLCGHSSDNRDSMFFSDSQASGLKPSVRDATTISALYLATERKPASVPKRPKAKQDLATDTDTTFVPAIGIPPLNSDRPNASYYLEDERRHARSGGLREKLGNFLPFEAE